MHDTQLDTCLRVHCVDGVRETFQAANAGDKDIVQTTVFEFGQHIEPELRALVFGQPHTQKFFLAFDIDTQCQEHGFVDDAAVLPNFQYMFCLVSFIIVIPKLTNETT